MNVQGSPRLHIKFGADGEAEKLEMKPRTEVDETENESTAFLTEIGDGRKVEETDIMAYPLMTTMEPKALDVIAFKVYKLDSGYEPQISSYITARVLTFDEETKAVNLEILAGGDEFLQPEGKFFMNVEEPSKTNKYTLDWAELIEPRLLYP
nr:coilin-like [Leptinotarsa decemlineata]